MINKRTVFVLGAGASKPYGLPLGEKLLHSICTEAVDHASGMAQSLAQPGLATRESLKELGVALRRSKQPSIDAFLSRREDLWEVGKLAIAFILMREERSSSIFGECEGDDWFAALWAAMTYGTGRIEDVAKNEVRFVTFNYDRSLEYMLHEGLRHTFNVGAEIAESVRTQIPILHVYGDLGKFGVENGGGARSYSPKINADTLRIAADGLRIIPEARKDDKKFEEAQSWFGWSQQICFLGFGFDRLNVERLALNSVLAYLRRNVPLDPIPQLFASAYKMTQMEVSLRIHNAIGPVADTKVIDDRNLMTLRTTGVLG